MRHERGQSAVEFIVVTLCVALALLVPWMDGKSPADMLLVALAEFAASQTAWLKIL
jgi:hypothetical protein